MPVTRTRSAMTAPRRRAPWPAPGVSASF